MRFSTSNILLMSGSDDSVFPATENYANMRHNLNNVLTFIYLNVLRYLQ